MFGDTYFHPPFNPLSYAAMSTTSTILTRSLIKTAGMKKEAKFRLADDKTLTKLCQVFAKRGVK